MEIWVVPPAPMRVIPDKQLFIKGYSMSQGLSKQEFAEKDIIHFKFPSPNSLYYGTSPLAQNTTSYNISQSMNRYEQAVFENMGRLEGAFVTENELSNHEFKRLKEEIAAAFRGSSNAGKSPLLEKGVTFKNFSASPRDLSFLQGRSKVKEEIMNAYGQSLGLWDKDSTRANAMVATESFMRDAIRPRLIRQEEKLNEKLTPRYDEKLFVAYDDPVPEDKDFKLKERESNLKSGYTSINMERESDHSSPVPWGDIPIMPQMMIPLGSKPVEPSGSSDPNESEEEMSRFIQMGIDSVSDDMTQKLIERLERTN